MANPRRVGEITPEIIERVSALVKSNIHAKPEEILTEQQIENRLAHNKSINIRIGKLIYRQRQSLIEGDIEYAQKLEHQMDCLAEERLEIPPAWKRILSV